jgi:hypothetical protein
MEKCVLFIHPSILDFSCWLLLIHYKGQSEPAPTSTEPMQDGWMGVWTRNIFSLVTPAQVDENRSNMDRKGKSLLSPTLLEATEVQPKKNPKNILFYF